MSAARLQRKQNLGLKAEDVPARSLVSTLASSLASRPDERLAGLSSLAAVDIETPLVANLSGDLHAIFDRVSDDVLPIYFGPLLGRLYLEGL